MVNLETSADGVSVKSILFLFGEKRGKRKEMITQEVAKNGSVMDQWLRDKVNPLTWDKNLTIFPQVKACWSNQKWMN